MIIAGAGGFAKEVFEVLNQKQQASSTSIYVDIPLENVNFFPGIKILSTTEQLRDFFQSHGAESVIGIGNPEKRHLFTERITALGAQMTSVISDHAEIGSMDIEIGDGTIILGGVRVSNSVSMGAGCIVYYNAIITHDCSIGKFVEISPGATVLGKAHIGDFCQLGANSTILPGVKLGKNVVVGAGAVVTKNFPDNSVLAGVPARLIRQSTPLSF